MPESIFETLGVDVKTLTTILGPVWQIIESWWWIILPILLYRPFLFLWLWWRKELWLKKQKAAMLEVKIPKDVLKPIRAMESVMSSIHGAVYHPPDLWEKWIDGQIQLGVSFEIVSFGGEPRFFVRTHKTYQQAVESSIYAQYPEAEIKEVEDYTNLVPQDIPNKDWDMWASDYMLLKPNPYPIKTYPKFETEREPMEEKRIDPISSLMEAMAKIKPDEQLWVQIRAAPIAEKGLEKHVKEGHAIRDKLARRPDPKKQKSMVGETIDVFLTGKPAGVEPEVKELIPPEMKLTPGEKEILAAIEEKISKLSFRCGARFIYLGKKDVFFRANFRLAFTFFNSFVTANLNAIYPWGKTLSKIHKSWFLPLNLILRRRLYLRNRRIFKRYKTRDHPLFPRTTGDKGIFILNTEELASLYHFPGRAVAPSPFVPRVEVKKGEAPPGLPVE